jgi:hypothetical protein
MKKRNTSFFLNETLRWLCMERVKGIEPSSSAWKAEVLPLNYTRIYMKLLTTVFFPYLHASSSKSFFMEAYASRQLGDDSWMCWLVAEVLPLNYTRICVLIFNQ